jgi:hypothetical protein
MLQELKVAVSNDAMAFDLWRLLAVKLTSGQN